MHNFVFRILLSNSISSPPLSFSISNLLTILTSCYSSFRFSSSHQPRLLNSHRPSFLLTHQPPWSASLSAQSCASSACSDSLWQTFISHGSSHPAILFSLHGMAVSKAASAKSMEGQQSLCFDAKIKTHICCSCHAPNRSHHLSKRALSTDGRCGPMNGGLLCDPGSTAYEGTCCSQYGWW